MKATLVVVGNGMVGQKLLDCLVDSGGADHWRILVFGEERRPAYDRVNLSTYFDGRSAEDLSLLTEEVAERVELVLGDPVVSLDRAARTVTTASGRRESYDALVLATGSAPFVPPLEGADGAACFVYRTLDDLDAIREAARGARAGVVLGGGLLGLEAANALRHLGLRTDVVEMAPRLMPVQVDEGGGAILRQEIEALGIGVRTGAVTRRIAHGPDGVVLEFDDGEVLQADLVVISAGIRPRDALAREAGLDVGERGGVAVDEACRTSDPAISAIGECASFQGRVYGLVAPGYAMARVVADRLTGGDAVFAAADLSTKLKLLGVDVASFGDAHADTEGARSLVWSDPVARVYRKVVVDGDGTRLLGGVLVGDAADYASLHQRYISAMALPPDPADLVLPARSGGGVALGPAAIPMESTICSCNNVTKAAICGAIAERGLTTVGEVKACTSAGTGCGSCVPLVKAILEHRLEEAGVEVDRSLCEHFRHTRQELADIVRVREVRTFAELLEGWGHGRGCEICKPAVASILASFWNEYVLADEHLPLQDTNDRFLANLQKDGTYSVVPRVPGGELTPAQLIVLGEVARAHDLYTKITGGQRVDLFGARLDELPGIWARLVDAGFESGHAYGKALRTVKSCVGETWCRYGVQDSTSLAIDLELRYRGLRAPHKIKCAVSGCARECAEAQGKDVGVIATEKGWNLYVCGNGGMRPQHAVLLAEDIDTATLIRYVDRFLMFYVRTADRLERTATWLNRLEGGVEYLRRVVVDDDLGICGQLEADMARHVATYQCEWKATLADPARLQAFRHFVNDDAPDPTLAYVRERGQRRPARPEERTRDDMAGVLLPLAEAGPGGRA